MTRAGSALAQPPLPRLPAAAVHHPALPRDRSCHMHRHDPVSRAGSPMRQGPRRQGRGAAEGR